MNISPTHASRKIETEAPSGILLIDKAPWITSASVVQKIKSALRREYNLPSKGANRLKIGHGGTLDPFATGLLIVLVGKATKRFEELSDGEKVYSGEILFGITTDTDDITGNLTSVSDYIPSFHEVQTALNRFIGEISQIPPHASALHVQGRRAYDLFREGEIFELPSRTIKVSFFQLGNVVKTVNPIETKAYQGAHCSSFMYALEEYELIRNAFFLQTQKGAGTSTTTCTVRGCKVPFIVRCSKGTYIRSLARDLGAFLGTGAILFSLRREVSAPYTIEHAKQLESVSSNDIILME
jgi:tRNA pseudouridine55 synthase